MIIITKYEDCMQHLQGTKYGELLNKVRFNVIFFNDHEES